MPRLPVVTQPSDANREAYEYIKKTRGSVRGGFAVMLASPEVTQRIAHVGTYVRFESGLPPVMRELAVLTASAQLENPVESAIHERACRELGVPDAILAALRSRLPVEGAGGDEGLAIIFALELTRDHRLSDATFQDRGCERPG